MHSNTNTGTHLLRRLVILTFSVMTFVLAGGTTPLQARQEEPCYECHGEKDFIVERDGRDVSLYVSKYLFSRSVHAELGCAGCHEDAEGEDGHEERLAKVDCSICHDDAAAKFDRSLHGEALAKRKFLAPTCLTCHGKHFILPSTDERAKTYVMNIPSTCGQCHKDGTKVSQLRTVKERHALEDYSQSIHGDGLFRRGLVVTAVCTSCHMSHDILPHENPASSIHRKNVVKTCTQCHVQIEKVHTKVIKGELWEKQPHQIPDCIDCHQPHKVRRVFYTESFPDSDCLKCHENPETGNGLDRSLHVNVESLRGSVHATLTCVKCHTEVRANNKPVCKDSGPVDCAMCHAGETADYEQSLHNAFRSAGNENAPYCTDCHGVHETKAKNDGASPTFARNIPDLCGRCHQEGQKAAVTYTGTQHDIVKNYTMSIHGKGLLESGLLVTATCISCHTAHRELPASDSLSTVHKNNIAETCSSCHLGIYEEFQSSIHSPRVSGNDKELPGCSDCHLSHTIKRVDVGDFRQGIMDQCGKCHLEVTERYFDTFHGKVSKLGAVQTAKCYDCHGAHNILPTSNPKSLLSRANIVETCSTCHPGSNRQFVGYLTHATHHNKARYPYLYYSFWFMTVLLVSTFGFFGAHTLLWVPRAITEVRSKRKLRNGENGNSTKPLPRLAASRKTHVRRFDSFSRFLHLLIIVSFLSLAITGMTIKFSGIGVFQSLSALLGGYAITGFVHRVAAIMTFAYFFLHLGHVVYKKRRNRIPWRQMLTGENGMLPSKRDFREFGQTIKWFLGMGKRPEYGTWTYWEKFDYFAVFWGVAIIGSSGLVLWFPEYFTAIGLPGWLINVATIVHSDEALLATGFIFTIHFFNTHFRPDKFPMDPVIFTGSVSLDELKEDRPREYAELIRSRQIKKALTAPPSRWFELGARIFGLTCLAIGIATIVLIIYAMLFLYK